ncbi:hypothetical protein Moror_7898 [Moniliophthora roreri MCA 2997]|uniref:Uncharacterized protein n=2 Tax=Moniliophthora roreri TaxID=221103 RepID=V2WT53_MONRO|nr:hypothetical protein Moror_7898 [Moniliophthora roreri MCA 2997]
MVEDFYQLESRPEEKTRVDARGMVATSKYSSEAHFGKSKGGMDGLNESKRPEPQRKLELVQHVMDDSWPCLRQGMNWGCKEDPLALI